MSGKDRYEEFPNVEKQKNRLIPEEFPEGPVGSPFLSDEPVKSTPWEEGQYRDSAFVYPDRKRHEDLPRQTPGAHPTDSEEE